MDTAAPSPAAGQRIAALDALRGLAVIGIAWMNVYIFAMPPQAYLNPRAWGGETPLDLAIWAASFILVEDKFRTLFAMLFGAGCAILLARAEPHPLRGHFARMAVLLAFGLVHATLLASNDILRAYALAGLALPLFMRLSPRGLLLWAGAIVALHMAATSYALQAGAGLAEANFGADPGAIAAALEQGRESFAERIARRGAGIPSQIVVIAGSLPLNLATMLVGIALWHSGLMAARWQPRRLARRAAVLASLSLPVLAVLAWLAWRGGLAGATVGMNALVWSAPFDLLLGVAYAAAAMALFQRCDGHGWVQRLAATGRLSLTNYLMTSLLFSLLFAAWGLGLFGSVSRAQALALTAVPIVGMVLWSPLWLTHFRQGPCEWLWRSLSQARAGPLRR